MEEKTRKFSFPLIPVLVGFVLIIAIIVFVNSFGKTKNETVDPSEIAKKVEISINNYIEKNEKVKTIGTLIKENKVKKVYLNDKYIYAVINPEFETKLGKGEILDKINDITELKDVFVINSAFQITYMDKNGNVLGEIEYITETPITDENIYMFNPETGAITGLKEELGYKYKENKGFYTNSTALVIPSQIGGVAVKSVSLRTKIDKNGNQVKDDEFLGYMNLEKIIISEGIETIEEESFMKCVALEEVVIPETVKTIKKNAFYGCSSYENIKLPNQIEKIGKTSFEYTKLFNNIEKGEIYIGNIFYKYKGNMIENTIQIKEGTRVIADGALENQTILDSIKLPDSLEYIGEYSFSGCVNVSNLKMPENLKVIYSSAINGCSQIGNLMVSPNTEIRK